MNDCGLCGRDLVGDVAGHYLCPGDTAATRERLDRIPAQYDALAAFLAPAGRRPELGGARPAEAPLPVREPVLDLRGPGGIVGVLLDWERGIREALGWSPPPFRGDTRQTVEGAARFLLDNLLWVATEWPEAGQLAAELRDLERAVTSIVDPPEKTLRLGYCTTEYADGSRCGAVLRVPAGTADVTCPWCQAAYPPDTWLALRAAQTDPEGAPA